MNQLAGTFDEGAAAAADSSAPLALAPGLSRLEVVVNPASGGVGARAAADCERLLADYPLDANIAEAGPDQVEAALAAALANRPDALIVLAGDGTARTAAAMAGLDGPPVAPLPGGTMNMLPKALYGTTDWKAALVRAITEGVVRPVSGGEVDGRPFVVVVADVANEPH